MELRSTAGLFSDRSRRVHLQLLGDTAKVSKIIANFLQGGLFSNMYVRWAELWLAVWPIIWLIALTEKVFDCKLCRVYVIID